MTSEASPAPRGRASPLAPITLGLIVTALCAGTWFLLSRLLGFPPLNESLPVTAVLTGYGVMAAGLVRRELLACLSALGALAGRVGDDPDASVARFFSGRTSRRGAVVGAVLGVVLAVLDPAEGAGFRTRDFWRVDLVFWIPMMGVLFGLIGAGVSTMLRVTRELVAMGRSMEGLDLLELEALEPLARYALRTSLLWIVGTSIAAFAALQGQLTAAVIVLMAGVFVMALAILLLPLRGARRRVQEVKREELTRVNLALRDARADLFADRGTPLADLLAWRDFVDTRPEWPLDAGAFARFAFYMSIGLGSWVGAALVERALEVAIR